MEQLTYIYMYVHFISYSYKKKNIEWYYNLADVLIK